MEGINSRGSDYEVDGGIVVAVIEVYKEGNLKDRLPNFGGDVVFLVIYCCLVCKYFEWEVLE